MRNVLSCRYSSRIAGLTLATILTFICGPTAQAEGSSGETAETVNKGSEKLLVLPFSGPKTVAIDDDIIWKMKTGNTDPTKEELNGIPRAISSQLTEKLKAKLGKAVVTESELNKAMDEAGLSATADKSSRNNELARKLAAGYLVEGNIDRLEFDGNTVLSDKYVVIVTAKLQKTDGAGSPLWRVSARKFYKKVKAAKGRSVASVFTDEQVPEIAETLALEIAQALGR
ncbi:MAG TPA: hypothetical protein PL112_04055 [Candidatus Obscuribacter sp.]|nr:hypothetical protein [Candidatus Obscuribacter sp.]HND65938.1 hypothetical protein [Candidatus Obscuribacter sp.]